MSCHPKTYEIKEQEMLIAFFDLTGFVKINQNLSARAIFSLMSGFYELVGDLVESSGGRVIKFIGDAGLIAFPAEKADKGVLVLFELKEKSEKWLLERGYPSKNIIKAHFGPMAN